MHGGQSGFGQSALLSARKSIRLTLRNHALGFRTPHGSARATQPTLPASMRRATASTTAPDSQDQGLLCRQAPLRRAIPQRRGRPPGSSCLPGSRAGHRPIPGRWHTDRPDSAPSPSERWSPAPAGSPGSRRGRRGSSNAICRSNSGGPCREHRFQRQQFVQRRAQRIDVGAMVHDYPLGHACSGLM